MHLLLLQELNAAAVLLLLPRRVHALLPACWASALLALHL
jgi:hypothetical protein